MSQQNETLQVAISLLQKNESLSPRKKIKLIMKVVKSFAAYAKDTDTLPPETLIPCCLFVLPLRFCELLNIEVDEPLDIEPEQKAVELALQTYLKSLGVMIQKSDEQIKHVIIEGLNKSILLTVPYPKISKRWLKSLIGIWATETMNINLGLRAFMTINKFLKHINEQTFMWTLRRVYVAYFENSRQVSWRNLEHVNFMINCFCELVKINEERTYYVMFGYVRSIALQMANLNKTKRKEKIELTNKLYSNQILNCFKLFTAVVSRVNSEELTSLIYPLIELTVAYEKISQANEFLPLKLHLLTDLLTIMQSTGVYIPPVVEIIENLLKNKLFSKKLGKRVEKVGGDLELSYKLSPADLTNTTLINQMFESVIFRTYWFISIVEKMPGGAEIIKKVLNLLKKMDFSFSGYKTQLSKAGKLLREDFYEHYKLRASKHVSIFDKKGVEQVQKTLQEKVFEVAKRYEQIREEKEELLRNKLLAENQEGAEEDQVQDVAQDQDQIDSGWEEAESGASSFHDEDQNNQRQHEIDDSDQIDQNEEKISLEGDLDEQAAEEAIKQWQEEEWDSQEIF